MTSTTRRATGRRNLALLAAAVLLTLGALAGFLGRHLTPDAAATVGPGTPSADEPVAATELDAELVRRFETARQAAADDGVSLEITSGLRSVAEQQRLYDQAVRQHGSPEAAARWVLPPEQSGHVLGTAIDVGGYDGMTWLGEHGAAYGLCVVYANEPWHFEAVVEPGGTCPPSLADVAAAGDAAAAP